MTEQPIRIIISTQPKSKPWWRLFVVSALQIVVIGVGVFADSAAMQWAGFVGLIFLFFCGVIISTTLGANKALSVDEARVRLDQLQALERASQVRRRW
jgi:uncharacterized membrane protein